MTPEVWDFIFLGIGDPVRIIEQQRKSTLTTDLLNRLRREFLFWYPVDLRSSGKDLIPNHLTYYLYNHTAVWPNQPELWPRAIVANGHLLLNSNKVSLCGSPYGGFRIQLMILLILFVWIFQDPFRTSDIEGVYVFVLR